MEKQLTKQLEQIAKLKKISLAEVWQAVFLERFLVRIEQSQYKQQFVLKGGSLLARLLPLERETRDIDFQVEQILNNAAELLTIMEQIVSIPVSDGFSFKNVKSETITHFHTKYPEAQIRIDASFGSVRSRLFIDLGFGEQLTAKEQPLGLLQDACGHPLFEESVKLYCSTLETIFAEKLETVTSRGATNSRMKDYHDLYAIVNKETICTPQFVESLQKVFSLRNTQQQIPLVFSDKEIQSLQKSWQRYCIGLSKKTKLPKTFSDILEAINSFLVLSGKGS